MVSFGACGYSIVVIRDLPKVKRRVRFPVPAQMLRIPLRRRTGIFTRLLRDFHLFSEKRKTPGDVSSSRELQSLEESVLRWADLLVERVLQCRIVPVHPLHLAGYRRAQ